jgi:feruloyl esterase
VLQEVAAHPDAQLLMLGEAIEPTLARLMQDTPRVPLKNPGETNAPLMVAAPTNLQALCNPDGVQGIAAKLLFGVTVKQISDAPKLPGGVKYVAATASRPGFCEVLGSFVTDPKTGRTANFLAVFPESWNSKYLQIGCSGHCGNFYVSDPTSSQIVVTNQGYVAESIMKGYASFSTDEGHESMASGSWAIKGPGQIDQGAVDDFYYRADKVLASVGKAFATAFYTQLNGNPQKVERSYFIGCSGGGRDALVAAAFFPEAFDGIIAGSPYAEMARAAFQFAGDTLAEIRSAASDVPPELLSKIDPIVKAKCDELDGVKDGLIQNPAACDFRPDRDLPKCGATAQAETCFTQAQIETISVLVSAVTDEHGNIVQPGYTVSELQPNPRLPSPPKDLMADEPIPNSPEVAGLPWSLGDSVLKVFVHQNDSNFHTRSLITFGAGGSGQVTNFHTIVPQAEVAKAMSSTYLGVGAHPEKMVTLIKQKRKLLIWANLSDQILTPYMSINYYKEMAKRYGGYAKLQDNVRLFLLPGTGHCSMFGCGPQNFDPLSAMENWVEKGNAPDGLIASQYESKSRMGSFYLDFSAPPTRTMPLCKFPEMAHFGGKGDVNDASNWSCPANDDSMLKIGESGRQAGVLK